MRSTKKNLFRLLINFKFCLTNIIVTFFKFSKWFNVLSICEFFPLVLLFKYSTLIWHNSKNCINLNIKHILLSTTFFNLHYSKHPIITFKNFSIKPKQLQLHGIQTELMSPQSPISNIITINIIRLSRTRHMMAISKDTRTCSTQRISGSKTSIETPERPRRPILDTLTPEALMMMLHHQRSVFVVIKTRIQIEQMVGRRRNVAVVIGSVVWRLHPGFHLDEFLRSSWRYWPFSWSQLDLYRRWRLDCWRFLSGHRWTFVASEFGSSILEPYL